MQCLSNPLRIGLVHWAFPPTTGGVESHMADLARMLAIAGHSVTVITGETSPITAPEYETITTPLLNLAWLRANSGDHDNCLQETVEELKLIISQRALNHIHGHNLHHFTAGPGLALERLREELGFRVYHTFHETWPDMLHGNPVYRKWNGNFAVSRFVQEQCDHQLGFCPQVLPLGIDLERFRCTRPAFSSRTAPPIIFHPARLLPWKGVHVSIEMVARLRDRGWQTRLMLTDTQRIVDWNNELTAYREKMNELISGFGLQGQVQLRSARYDEMPALYNEADLVVYPTVGDEPYGLVPLEAMACGRPIIASRSGGIPETVAHLRTGYVVERGNVDAVTGAVAELLANPDFAQRMGSAGRKHVEMNFNATHYVRTLLDHYGRK